jgi:hypothetical protein
MSKIPTATGTPGQKATAFDLLSAALDAHGFICIVGIRTATKQFKKQEFFARAHLANAVEVAQILDAQGIDAYWGTSTFETRDSRLAANVHAVKVLKLDLDVGPKKSNYSGKREAVKALLTFCTQTGLPIPTLVDSGGGVHVYWVLSKALPAADAKLVAEQLKTVTHLNGLKTDTTCTADLSRILRVPGTRNHKIPNHLRDVKLKSDQVVLHDTETIVKLIEAAFNACRQKIPTSMHNAIPLLDAVPLHLHGAELDDTTRSLMVGTPKIFETILRKSLAGTGCNQIKYAHDHQDKPQLVDEPRWRAGLSIAQFCTDRDEAIHTISRGYPGYSTSETDRKASEIKGPYTCSTFRQNWPEECEGCPFADKITSPIQLGIEDASALPSNEIASDDSAAIARLAALPPIEYERVRTKEAKALRMRTGVLDAVVENARKARQGAANSTFEDIEPWDDPVEGAVLLTEIATTIHRFIICAPETAHAAALWIVMTWLMDVVQIAPLAVITAPEKRCGKSLLLFLLARLTYRPLQASNITPAALFRSIDLWEPTLLIDEADAFMRENEELRGLLNCGHTRDSAFVIRTVGEDFTPTRFNVWGAKALAGIGRLADTLMDRAIILELRRKLPNEYAERLRDADQSLFGILRHKLARFALDHSNAIRAARPDLPRALNDRAQDNWEPLLAIADTAGGQWPASARAAALHLSGEKESATSINMELLSDIQEIFATRKIDRISSADLIRALCVDEEKRWCTYNKGFPIKPRQIVGRLKDFNIVSNTVRIGTATPKGYTKAQFDDAFARYLSPASVEPDALSATPPQANPGAGMHVVESNDVAVIYDTEDDLDEDDGFVIVACGE